MAFTKTLIVFLWKVISFKHGASFLFSSTVSLIVTITTGWLDYMNIITLDFNRFNNLFLKDAKPLFIFLPVLVEAGMIIFFTPMSMLDFILGHRIARQIRGEKFKPERFFDTIIKTIAIILITSFIVFLAFIMASMKMEWIWFGLMFFLCAFWTLCIGYEFSSIGRNFEILNGSKSSIFIFFDKILIVIEDKTMKKMESSIDMGLDNEKKNDNN